MHTKFTRLSPLARLRALLTLRARPKSKGPRVRAQDVPDYLRRDIGLLPDETARHSAKDPPNLRDPFRLL
ncbi:hypothetical protein [Hasllibacter sp. MH4015]|uniref:hypothetical protein n=1 Tax=Hasllibacter sp. MH4015 TaxID=2854029 RepID=UPI001CD75AAF|nr:hypothetical protein [Hasllibacter sp. MH4015]